jgi:putative membrane protein
MMSSLLSRIGADAIEARIERIERATGVQIVTAVVARSDAYPELVWKAFALGVAAAALFVVGFDIARPDWMSRYAAWSNVTPILCVGSASALLALVVPAYARLFLDRTRCVHEVRHRAQALFLERQLFTTHNRNGVLLFASVFERRVEVVADIGFAGRVGGHEWQTVIDAMMPALTAKDVSAAFARGLDRLEALLADKGIRGHGGRNELPDKPIVDEGA